ncbi:hypothetical protein [Enterococcus sp. HY326]|uniref:hypothetical protein n=1 Tax=Enterococcus sp. HY326 TaxID=2971265 RepID=UPI00223F5598|nr:hypothetical protein [Enterococcus sp. HY326]
MYETEIQQWQTWNTEHLGDASRRSAILKFLLEEVQTMFDGDLEGHYWSVDWGQLDESIIIKDVLGQPLDQLTLPEGSFVAAFEKNPAFFMRDLADAIKKIVAKH